MFTVTVKEVKAPVAVHDRRRLGEGAGLRETWPSSRRPSRSASTTSTRALSRARLKRALLDQLADGYPFAVPQGMVDLEFEAIWKQLQDEMERTGTGLASRGKSEDELKAEYRAIAERRVRLGLILSDIGSKNDVKVESEELQQAVMREAMRYQGQERKVFEFFKNNQAALEQLRAPCSRTRSATSSSPRRRSTSSRSRSRS